MIHGELRGQNVHVPYSFEFANLAARDAATGFVVADEGKFCRVLDTNTIYMLASSAPVTWVSIASNSSTGSTSVISSGATFPTAPVSWELFYRTDLDNVFVWNPLSSAWVDVTAANVSGDMFKATYDPNNVSGDTFAMDNMTQGTVNFFVSATEKAKIAGSEQVANKGVAGGYPSLDANGEVAQLPAGASAAAVGTFLRQDGQWVNVSSGTSSGIPNFTQAQINALTPVDGQVVYNSSTSALQFYSASKGAWIVVPSTIKKTQIVTSNLVLDSAFHQHISVSASTSPITITVPDPASNAGVEFSITAIDLTNTITVSIQNGLLDGVNVFSFVSPYDSITIVSNGNQWVTTSSNIKDLDVSSAPVDLTRVYDMIRQNIYNTGINTFRLMASTSLNTTTISGGFVDDYVTTNYIDNVVSSYGYNPGNSFLTNGNQDPIFHNATVFEPTVPTQHNFANVQPNEIMGASFVIHGTKVITNIKIPIFNWSTATNVWSSTGTGTLDFFICAMPAGMSIGAATDKPLHAYASDPANHLFSKTFTEGELINLLSDRQSFNFTGLNWLDVPVALPFILRDGEYFWGVRDNGLPAQSGAAVGIGYYLQSSGYEVGHLLQIFPLTTLNNTFSAPSIISCQTTTSPSVLDDNPLKTLNSTVAIGIRDVTYDGEIGITFRVSDYCTVDSVELPLCATWNHPVPNSASAGGLRIAIQQVEYGSMAAGTAVAYAYSSASRTATNIVEKTLTGVDFGNIFSTTLMFPSVSLAASHFQTGGQMFVVNFTPSVLAPGEYVITIDTRTNPFTAGEFVELIASNDPSQSATLSKMLRIGTGNTLQKTEHPIFRVIGSWDGGTSNVVVESTAQTAATAPTEIYASFVIDDYIDIINDIAVSVSRDNGTTWTRINNLSAVNNNASIAGTKIINGFASVTSQPTGTQIRYKFESFNGAAVKIHASSVQWN